MRVLEDANRIVRQKWRTAGKGWKVLLGVVIVIGLVIAAICLFLYFTAKFLKALAPCKVHNAELYFPKARRR